MRASINVSDSSKDPSVCDSDCPKDLQHKLNHEAVVGLLDDAIFEAQLIVDCIDDCPGADFHGVLAAAYLATLGVHDEAIHKHFGLPWLDERP